jgi:chitin disaccharide deacetylase
LVAVSEPLAVRLGFTEQTRVVIIAADGLGASHAATHGTYDSLRRGMATTGRLMVPCPWAREAAALHRGEDVGVSLTVLAEHERYRWGPITHAPSLVDGNGGFPSTAPDLWDHADLDEVRRECRAQLERAVFWGFDVTHLDSHLDVLHLRPEFFDIELELAIEFGLPLRLPSPLDERRAGFPFRSLAHEEGVVTPDHVVDIATPAAADLEVALVALEPGVTELRLRPAIDTPELRAISTGWATQVEHHQALVLDDVLRDAVKRSGVTPVGYRALRQVQRAAQG